jgi:hypothetical protein
MLMTNPLRSLSESETRALLFHAALRVLGGKKAATTSADAAVLGAFENLLLARRARDQHLNFLADELEAAAVLPDEARLGVEELVKLAAG